MPLTSMEPQSCLGCRNLLGRFSKLTRQILELSRHAASRLSFLERVSREIIGVSGADTVVWWLEQGQGYFRLGVNRDDAADAVKADHLELSQDGRVIGGTASQRAVGELYFDIIRGHFDPNQTYFTAGGSFWTGDTKVGLSYRSARSGENRSLALELEPAARSLVLIPLRGEQANIGFFQLRSFEPDFFDREQVEFFEVVAESISLALANQTVQAAGKERVKELTCLYECVRLAERPESSMDEILQGVVDLLPPAWQYPEITHGRVILDGRHYVTASFEPGPYRQTARILVGDKERGRVEVFYQERRPALDEGPFLREERHLIDALAREVSGIIERREAGRRQAALEEQLRHADRLTTLGQLAAGVAHELNEPLANILGFSQLAQKTPDMPEAAARDIEKIVQACLRAREIVSKLRLFARQNPAKRVSSQLNDVVREGSFLIEARCAKQKVRMVQDLDPNLSCIDADPGQLHQMIVNLTMNAVQAMPEGGTMIIRTRERQREIALFVVDDGAGMTEEVRAKAFLPFFTTKEVDQGTGLGLSVVHGIVASHGGAVEVESSPGKGTTLEVRLPKAGGQLAFSRRIK